LLCMCVYVCVCVGQVYCHTQRVGWQRLHMEASSSGIGKGMGMSVRIGMEYGRVVNNSKIIH